MTVYRWTPEQLQSLLFVFVFHNMAETSTGMALESGGLSTCCVSRPTMLLLRNRWQGRNQNRLPPCPLSFGDLTLFVCFELPAGVRDSEAWRAPGGFGAKPIRVSYGRCIPRIDASDLPPSSCPRATTLDTHSTRLHWVAAERRFSCANCAGMEGEALLLHHLPSDGPAFRTRISLQASSFSCIGVPNRHTVRLAHAPRHVEDNLLI